MLCVRVCAFLPLEAEHLITLGRLQADWMLITRDHQSKKTNKEREKEK